MPATETAVHVDIYGNAWPANYELCEECGQPDNIGDCNHKQLTTQEIRFLGGWIKLDSEQKYHRLHYNFVAKRLRNHYPQGGYEDVVVMNAQRRVVEDIALEFASRFKEDNPDFDAPAFLDQCSPNPDLYPFSELWEVPSERPDA